MLACAVVTGVAVAGLLVAEYRDWRAGVWLFKPVAAAGFIGVAVVAGALQSPYGRWVLLALALCFAGDVLLIPRAAPRVFRAGILSFLLGHVAYVVAFLANGVDLWPFVAAAVSVAAMGGVVLRWLLPRVTEEFRLPVGAYVVVISAMVALGAGAWTHSGDPGILAGALMFYVSDLAVARDRFVHPAFSNRAWGLPLYFGGQLILAWTVAS